MSIAKSIPAGIPEMAFARGQTFNGVAGRTVDIKLLPNYDNRNGWQEILPEPATPNMVAGTLDFDYVVVGAGYGGLACARRLAELTPQSSIALVEADRIGNNAAGRSSGFAIDHAHNLRAKSFAEDPASAKKAIAFNRAGLDELERLVTENQIDCDLRRQGKIHAACTDKGAEMLAGFAQSLDAIDEDYTRMGASELKDRFGTDFYHTGILCPHSITVQPAALVRGLADSMPANVTVYESSPVRSITYARNSPATSHRLVTSSGTVTTPNLILAVNGFAAGWGLYTKHLIPLITWGSMTRELTDKEVSRLGGLDNYAIIPAHPAGTTVRRLPTNRILIRNQYTLSKDNTALEPALGKIVKVHRQSFENRYPMLTDVQFEYSWGGPLSLSRNGEGVFGDVGERLWATMAYQGVGLARGTISGKLLAEHILGEDSNLLTEMRAKGRPSRNFPDPFNSWGIRANAWARRRTAGLEE